MRINQDIRSLKECANLLSLRIQELAKEILQRKEEKETEHAFESQRDLEDGHDNQTW